MADKKPPMGLRKMQNGKGFYMKERPILFSAPMVRAILDGSKTQTRRVLKGTSLKWTENFSPEFIADKDNFLCPYGFEGDQIWVCEAFAPGGEYYTGKVDGVIYRADFKDGGAVHNLKIWKPSIHMPRAASRIDLLIKSVRIERLQDISPEDAMAEGVEDCICTDGPLCNFIDLWQKINGNWDENPWVWVVEFERIKP